MRILVFSHGYPPTISGVTLFAQKLARAMVRKGHAVTLVAASERGQPYISDDNGVQLVRVRSTHNPLWKEGPLPWVRLRTLLKLAEEFQPDIVHTHELVFLGWQAQRLGRRLRVPVLATCHMVPKWAANRMGKRPWTQALVEKALWAYGLWFCRRFDYFVFPTLTHKEHCVERGLKVRMRVISYGVDTTRYHPANPFSEEEVGNNLPPRPRIVFVSRISREKEIDVLIRALSRIRAEREANLLLIGDGNDRPRLEALAGELGLRDRVHFLGWISQERLPAYYRASDVYAIASACETQSIPTVEAAACGLPLVAVDAVALPELVQNGENGFLVPPSDPEEMAGAILRILRDPDLAARMGQASRAIGQAHAETRTFGQYEDLYREAITEQGAFPVPAAGRLEGLPR